ncbi:hypothetical protein [Cytobacillus horneckiae]|uniref:hypothetical protein n=1 Tax=Cytobacillus horneckiae TaxID=549687 RepID=UPI003D9AAEC6
MRLPPKIGRFLVIDEYEGEDDNPISFNRYLYAEYDPVNNIDPDGYAPKWLKKLSKGVKKAAKATKKATTKIKRSPSKKVSSKVNKKPKTVAAKPIRTAPKVQSKAKVKVAATVNRVAKNAEKTEKHVASPDVKASNSKSNKSTNTESSSESTPRFLDKPTAGDNVGSMLRNKEFPSFSHNEIRYTQDSIKKSFKDGGTVDDLATGLKDGSINKNDIPAIRVFQHTDGNIYSLDNRRLYAFKQAGIDPPQVGAPSDLVKDQIEWKMSTKNNGTSIRLR